MFRNNFMKRIFTAIDISDETRLKASNYLEKLKSEFPNVRVGWDKAEKLHLTLKFLGDINEIQLENLSEAVADTARQTSNFEIQIAETGVFPSKRNARVLWLGVRDDQGSLLKLNEMLEEQCSKRGFAKETRAFKAHLTIARLREPQKSAELIKKHLSENFDAEKFTVSAISIYESQLLKSGSIYSIVSKHKIEEKAG